MMGTKTRAFAPLCNRTVEDLVPADNFYRHLEAKLDLAFVRDLVRSTYKERGRPSVDPEVFFKLQLVMFFEGIRSERQLMRVAADRLSVRWYLGYDLDEELPDHSSLTRIRQRYGLAVFRRFFEAIVEQCREAGLVWGKELYFDATQVKANASLDSIAPRFAVEAHLGELFTDDASDEPSPDAGDNQPIELPVPITEAEREQLAHANEERHDWLARDGAPDRTIVRGGYRRRSDFEASTTDPDAALMALKKGGLHFGYHDHYAVDGGKARIILEVLVTPADVMENLPVPGHALARLLPLAAPARPGDRRRHLRHGCDDRCRRGPGDPCLRPALRRRQAARLLRPRGVHLRRRAGRLHLPERHRAALPRQPLRRPSPGLSGRRPAPATPARSKRDAPTARRDGSSRGASTKPTWTVSAGTTRPPPTERPCASGASGSSRCSVRPRTGTASSGSDSEGSGR